MMGIYFYDCRRPQRLVFVEVKSTDKAIGDMKDDAGSSLMGHLKKTLDNFKSDTNIANRKSEACLIINNYRELGLRGLDPQEQEFKIEDFESIKELEALFLFTDDVINFPMSEVLNSENEKDKDLKRFINSIEIVDVSNTYKDCKAYSFKWQK